MLKLVAIERPPVSADQQPPKPIAAVKFDGKVGDFARFEVTAYLNQGLTDDGLVRDAQVRIRDAVAVRSEELNTSWPEDGGRGRGTASGTSRLFPKRENACVLSSAARIAWRNQIFRRVLRRRTTIEGP